MKASILLQKVLENSKGTAKVEGEMATPSYSNLKTPNNHVSGKSMKTVDGNKRMGADKQLTNKAEIGKPNATKTRNKSNANTTTKTISEAEADTSKTTMKPAKAASVKSQAGDNTLDNKGDIGEPKGYSPGTEKMGVAVKKVTEGVAELQKKFGVKVKLDFLEKQAS